MKQSNNDISYGNDNSYNNTSKKTTNVGDSIPIDSSVNHYELPNLTTCTLIYFVCACFNIDIVVLYDFTNKEQEII
jgi:hypothetical protein